MQRIGKYLGEKMTFFATSSGLPFLLQDGYVRFREGRKTFWVVVSNIFYFQPDLGKIPILTNIFQMGWFNHQLDILSDLKGIFPDFSWLIGFSSNGVDGAIEVFPPTNDKDDKDALFFPWGLRVDVSESSFLSTRLALTKS